MKRVLMMAMLAAAIGTSTGCRVVDTVLLGQPCCGGRAPCGSTCDPCAYGGGRSFGGGGDCGCSTGGDCGCSSGGGGCGCDSGGCDTGGCGGCGTCSNCHPCPLFEMFGFLHPDRLLCAYEYRDCDGCGDRYWGDWYQGERAGCESCDCHGNYAGPRGGSYSPRSSRVMNGEVIEEQHGSPTPADAAPKPPVKPGPEQGAMIKKSSGVQRRSSVASARMARSSQPTPKLRPVGSEPEWTARRGQ